MRKFRSRSHLSDTVMISGWIFADLLLALAVIFLSANTVGVKPQPIPTPTPTPIAVVIPTATPSPTPTPVTGQRVLEGSYCRIVLDDNNPDRFSTDLGFAEKILEPQINAISFLKARSVGTAIAYGGISNISDLTDVDRGTNMASKVYDVLRDLGNKNPRGPFGGTSYYDPLFTSLNVTAQNVVIDVYLVERLRKNTNTCNSNHNPV